ncbi:MAG: hypothetical protein LBC63_09175 [Holophagales bacterium]|jgi:hypothetical protein|nr:hypothetical protein [Holophagales bacterium]
MRKVIYTRTRWGNGKQHKLAYRRLPAWRYQDAYRLKGTRKRGLYIPPLPGAHELLFYILKRRHGLNYDLLVKRSGDFGVCLYIHRV